jgi:AmmeMemoRadiSam system protein B
MLATLRMVRPPAVAGMFYPADAGALERQLAGFFERAVAGEHAGPVRGVIAPHAGYIYSGATAAAAYSRLKGKRFDTVVIVAPSHRDYFEGASVYAGDAYRTPLGDVPLDVEMRTALLKATDRVTAGDSGHRSEHAVEVQIPFLQMMLGSFAILPIVMGDQNRALCFALAEALDRVRGEKEVLFVASTDLSHYHSAKIADAIDGVTTEDIRSFDHRRLMDHLESGAAEACGGGPTVAVMGALIRLGAKQMEVVHHCNSGDITGEKQNVVGYLSAVAW